MVRIITDTTACLPTEVATKYQIPIIPQIIHFGEETFYEGIDMDNTAFIQRLKTAKELPKTSAPPPELFRQQFSQLAPSGEPILCIHPSLEVSGTVRSALTASLDFPGADIRVIDTRIIAAPLGSMVSEAARLAAEGASAERIVQRLDDLIQRCRIYFMIETLEYLLRGGRIGGASALLGSVLQVKPILTAKNGVVSLYERGRTSNRGIARMKELVFEQISPDGDGFLSVMHADRLADGLALADDLKAATHQELVPVIEMCPAIVAHGGPGILAVGFFAR